MYNVLIIIGPSVHPAMQGRNLFDRARLPNCNFHSWAGGVVLLQIPCCRCWIHGIDVSPGAILMMGIQFAVDKHEKVVIAKGGEVG